MRSASYIVAGALLIFLCSPPAVAGGGKGNASRRGGEAASHMSVRGFENSNAQWSADPQRGWVRANERHELHEQRHTPPPPRDNSGRHKGQTEHGSHGSGNY